MTIQEAIKSGKRYRRKSWASGLWTPKSTTLHNVSNDDILADDWEIEREPETIWLVKHLNHDFYDGVFRCEDMAKRSTAASNKNASVVKFREVIE